MPAEYMAGILALELFIHGWDFAQAIGEQFDAPDHLTAYVERIVEGTVSAEARGEGKGFAEAREPVTGDPIDRLMAFTGRTPMATG